MSTLTTVLKHIQVVIIPEKDMHECALYEGMREAAPPHLLIVFFLNNTDLIGQVWSSSMDRGSFFMVNFEKVHPNFEEESRKWMIWKKFWWPSH